MTDKREYPRYEMKGKVRFRVPEQMDISMASIKNISGGGLCLLTEPKVKAGQKLSLEFGLPGDVKPILGVGKVCWVEELDYPLGRFNFRVGIEFVKIDEERQARIDKFVVNCLKSQIKEEVGRKEGERIPDSDKITILAIDDDKVTLKLIKDVFKDEFNVIVATSGHMGLEKARELDPDIILLDIIMPDMDGFSTLMLLKDFPETAKIPVIMLSVVREKTKVFQAIQHGANDFMIKPFTSETIIKKIKKYKKKKN